MFDREYIKTLQPDALEQLVERHRKSAIQQGLVTGILSGFLLGLLLGKLL
jgi:hypothetical protein